jgi:hypothetical protein
METKKVEVAFHPINQDCRQAGDQSSSCETSGHPLVAGKDRGDP